MIFVFGKSIRELFEDWAVFSASGEYIIGGFPLRKTFDDSAKSLVNMGKF